MWLLGLTVSYASIIAPWASIVVSPSFPCVDVKPYPGAFDEITRDIGMGRVTES